MADADRGTGAISTAAGVLVFLVFLMGAVQLLFSLYASSTVTAVANDAAQRAAAAGAPPLSVIEADARASLGKVGDDATFSWASDDADGDGTDDTVVLRVIARPPRFVPASVGEGLGLGTIDRTVRVRARGAAAVTRARCHGDRGQVGGIEALPFGLLVFVLGSLLIANAWAVIDAKFATDAAARQAARTFVEATDETAAVTAAVEAGRAAIAGHGRDPDRAVIGPVGGFALARCARATFEAVYEVPALSIPLIGGYGTAPFRVRSSHSEVVDPFRSGLTGQAEDCT